MIALVGFMGAGKTTVGRLLAARLGLYFVDTDSAVERRAGMTIAELFSARGESAFRALEREVIVTALDGENAVLSLGGGALGDPSTCASLEWATVVHLEVGFGVAMRRIGADPRRPLLAVSDPKALFDERRALYRRLADITVSTDGKRPDAVAGEIESALASTTGAQASAPLAGVVRVAVPVSGAPYDVVIGKGVAGDAASIIPLPEKAEKALVVTHPGLEHLVSPVASSLAGRGLEVSLVLVAEGEGAKSLGVAAELYDSFADIGAHRHDLVVGFGGGVITDLSGYVASTYHRGMAVAHVPTTLLGQVDAAIGGKTGVNLSYGKNLIGTIHQPTAVICDVAFLSTLPGPELVSGMAEVIKAGLIGDEQLLDLVTSRAGDLLAQDPELLIATVASAAGIKASIAAEDPHERGRRAVLNYGHTFAHAIEHAASFKGIRHGEAVSIGMMCAAYVAAELGRIDGACVESHARALRAYGLPTSAALDLETLERAWKHDKKYDKGVRFVLLNGPAHPEAGVAVPRPAIERALERMA